MRRLAAFLAACLAVGLIAIGLGIQRAEAGGSDSATPYTVDVNGITLPAGATFGDNGHVNIKTDKGPANVHFEAKCVTRTDAECKGKRHDDAQFIGKSFIPWSAFGIDKPCVSWVQLAQFNEHYGEGGQPPVGPGCTTTPTPEPTPPAVTTPTPPVVTTPTPEPTPPVVTEEPPTPEPTPPVVTTPTPEPTPPVDEPGIDTPIAEDAPRPTPIEEAPLPTLTEDARTLPATGGPPLPLLVAGGLLLMLGVVIVGLEYARRRGL